MYIICISLELSRIFAEKLHRNSSFELYLVQINTSKKHDVNFYLCRCEALNYFRAHKPWQNWEERVLHAYVNCGFKDLQVRVCMGCVRVCVYVLAHLCVYACLYFFETRTCVKSVIICK